MTHRADPGNREILEALQSVLQEASEPAAVLEAILRQAVQKTGAERSLIAEVLEGGELRFGVLMGFREKRFRGDADAFSRHIFDRVLSSGESVRIENALDDPFFREVESVRALGAGALLCMPIRVDGRIVALLHLEDPRPGCFQPAHLDLLRALLAVAEPALGALRAGRETIEERNRLRSAESQLRHEAEAERRGMAAEWSFGRFIGHSPSIRELEAVVAKAAATDFPVLLLGEPGTGKNLLARVLHYGGARSAHPFITVFCPSLERGMVEAELFGHRRGAFTGAVSDRLGRVQAADGGTLFLDEVGELPMEIQPKLLRFLQDRGFERVGDPKELKADVRIIAATNRDLALDAQNGRFRRDLYDRLNFLPIRVPPLRERAEDIPQLLRHCLDQSAPGRWVEVTPEALSYLRSLDFTWPGNVRHVEQLAARLAAEGLERPATAHDVARLLDTARNEGSAERRDAAHAPDLEAGLPRLLEEAERAWIETALRQYPDLSRAELAAKLRISEAALYRKLRRYAIGA
jgi:transcriptional regulator with GAF, ATPase, and Fis domain